MCDSGKWRCSENFCPARCVIEGYFVTTTDGKHYAVPGKCTYVASQVITPPFLQHFIIKLDLSHNAHLCGVFSRVTTGQ